jgi:hypothetical protein
MRERNDDDDDLILRDGERLRVPMVMMDSWQREMVDRFARLHDGAGNAVGRRPGFVVDAAAGRDLSFYDQYDAEVGEAWRSPQIGTGEREFVGQREGDLCTINGNRGHLRVNKDRGRLVCVPDEPSRDTMHDEREAAYEEYQNRIQNA